MNSVKSDMMVEESSSDFRLIAAPTYNNSNEKFVAVRFPSTSGRNLTMEQGNLAIGEWKILNGIGGEGFDAWSM